MGVNCLAVNDGTDTSIKIQLSDLVRERNGGDAGGEKGH